MAPPFLALEAVKVESMILDSLPWINIAPPLPTLVTLLALHAKNLDFSIVAFKPSTKIAPPYFAALQ